MKHFHYYTPLLLQKIGYIVFYCLYKIFVRIEIRGKENIEAVLKISQSGVILASNHTSELDVTTMPLVLPFFSSLFPMYFVTAQKEKYKTFGWRNYIYGGFFFNILGGYAVHKGNRDYALCLVDHVDLLKNHGRTLWIAPEGRRTTDGNIGPARGGLGYLVAETNAIVVPIAIDTFYNMRASDFFLRRKKVVITIGTHMTQAELFTTNTPGVLEYQQAGEIVLKKIGEMMR